MTFVALIILQWGADITSSYRYNPNSGFVGEVNGQEITRDQFDRVYQTYYQQQFSGRDVQPTQAETDRLRAEAWNSIVADVAVQQEIERRGIQISDQDLFYYIRFNPPPIVQNMSQFQTDGKFDYNRYQQIMADPSNAPFWASLEKQMIPQVRAAKMQEVVTTAARVTNQEIRDAYLLETEKAHFAFATRPISSLSSDSVTVTEDEMRAYLAENEYRFQREEMRSVQLALFSKEVSEADWERVGTEIAALADSIKSDTIPFDVWARSYSEHESAVDGGELGWYTIVGLDTTYVREALALKVGEVSGPVRTAFGWHIIKLLGMQDKDSVETNDPSKAALINTAQILLGVGASDETVDRAERQARRFYQLARDKGFSEAATDMGVEIKTTSPFQRAGSIQYLGSDFFAGEWAFSSDIGDISGIYDNASNFFVMRLDDILPAGTLSLDDIRASLETLVRNEKLKQMSLDTMKLVYQRMQEGVDMEKA
ncbi:MAG: SurA N-terminal domain-containing protein, partial [Candidatus Zixiibacteriota bacterium]